MVGTMTRATRATRPESNSLGEAGMETLMAFDGRRRVHFARVFLICMWRIHGPLATKGRDELGPLCLELVFNRRVLALAYVLRFRPCVVT